MPKRIHVGNLSFQTTEESLSSLFEGYGEVLSVSIIKDKATDVSKGFGFVELEDDELALKAVSDLSGKLFEGRKIRVSIANDRKPVNKASLYKKSR